ncbi:hypothetical protein [Niallia sp. 03133]|uniref:hypothetical protein n=1 Tax=Niallia sp. 03133 TaxID=3458060 RepID=UPI004044F331
MKYFTYELLTSLNNDSLSEEQLQVIEKQWENNGLLYSKVFKGLLGRIPNEIFTSFMNNEFHDYLLEKIQVEHTSLLHMNIHFILTNNEDSWKLSFTNISSLRYNHLNDSPFPIFNPEVDVWVKEELLPLDDNNLSFEVLLSSGANIQVSFKNKNIQLQKLK